MAQKIIRASDGQEIKKTADQTADTAKRTVKKAADAAPVKKAVKKTETAEPEQEIVQAKPAKGSSIPYRIGAIVLWVLAIGFELLAIMALTKNFTIQFTHNAATNLWIILIGAIVLDMACAIIAAQLWKKANRIKPMSKKNKFLFYLWNELGVVMACVCFIPLIILLIKNDKLDKKTKIIVTSIAAAALLITGLASADFNPISQEEAQAAESQITDDVYWTSFGHKYHLDLDCQAIRNSATVIQGSVTEAIQSGRESVCLFCARNHADEYDFSGMKVENGEAAEAEAVESPAPAEGGAEADGTLDQAG